MADHGDVARLIPWYPNGTLAPEDQRRVERHLRECSDCRALLDEARALEPLGDLDPDELLDHVQAQHLERFATAPDSIAPELAGWIREHLGGCEACRGALRILERSSADGAHPVGAKERASRERTSIWGFLTGTVLHPAAAAAYLAILALAIPVYRSVFHLPDVERLKTALVEKPDGIGDWSGAVDLEVLSSVLRGDDTVPAVVLDAGQPVLPLGVEFELPDEVDASAPIRFEVRRGDNQDELVWSQDLAAERIEHNLDHSGIVTLLLSGSRLSPGRYRLMVVPADDPDRRLILDATFEVVRASPEMEGQ
jgi:hypothetical protein